MHSWSAGDLRQAAEQFGTPLYVYDLDGASAQLERLAQDLPSSVQLYYAMKANSNQGVLRALRDRVAGLDISSIGELHLARPVGYSPERMSFAGPGKSDRELDEALAQGVGVISVESLGELRRLIARAEHLGRRAVITLRINPQSIPNAFMMKMGGRASQFGIAEEDIEQPIAEALAAKAIELAGFHIYAGTQCLEQRAIVENLEQTLAINARLAEAHDLRPTLANLGGGFGVPHFAGQEPLDAAGLSHEVGALVSSFVRRNPRFAAARFILELGRFVIGPFGVYLSRVIEVKETRGKRFAILDGGMNHCFAATGNFGQLVKKNYEMSNVSRSDAPAEPLEIVGPLCTPLDSLGRAVDLPHAEVGDVIAIHNAGAYAFSASPLLFLGHDTPVEVVRTGGRLELARARLPATRFV